MGLSMSQQQALGIFALHWGAFLRHVHVETGRFVLLIIKELVAIKTALPDLGGSCSSRKG